VRKRFIVRERFIVRKHFVTRKHFYNAKGGLQSFFTTLKADYNPPSPPLQRRIVIRRERLIVRKRFIVRKHSITHERFAPYDVYNAESSI